MSRQDMDLILSDGINAAVHFIEKSGEFFPFGVVKTSKGEIRHIQAMMEDVRPSSDSVCEVLKISLKGGGIAGDYDTNYGDTCNNPFIAAPDSLAFGAMRRSRAI